MKPIHYNLSLEPDLTAFTFKGKSQVEIDLEVPASTVCIHGKDLEIQVCNLRKESASSPVSRCDFDFDQKQQQIIVKLPSEMSGKIWLDFEFTGILNDMLAGFYRSRYIVDGETRYMATTQFEERDARAAFPCFDEPALKATFDLEFIVDSHLQGIANTAIKDEKTLESGKKSIKFNRTPRMSTYLLYFGIGEFEFLVDDTKSPILRIAAPPGKAQFGKFALDIARKSFDYGETVLKAPYPISKCDFLVVTDFAAGAMENYGAITFRENLLLTYEGKSSKLDYIRIAQVVAHEIAHMWFGDLVSPLKWKYIWLNESFATYFTYAIPDYFFPEWKSWETLVGDRGLGGMNRDSLIYTIPVELPGDEEVNIDASTAPIIYAKGAIIIRILEEFLGQEKFFKGIRHFLKKYEYDSASSEQCWEAFEEATGEPIIDFAHSWVNQPGFPCIEVSQEGAKVTLTQSRFTYLENQSSNLWVIPVHLNLYMKDGSNQTMAVVLKEKSVSFDLPADTLCFKLNKDQVGFYRVKYSLEHLDCLGNLIQKKVLCTLDRFGVQNDFYALTYRGDYQIKEYITFIQKYFSEDDSDLALDNIVENIGRLILISPKNRTSISEISKIFAESVLNRIGLDPQEDETMLRAVVRSDYLHIAAECGSQMAKDYAFRQFELLREGKDVPADNLGSILRIIAANKPETWQYMVDQSLNPDLPEGKKVLFLTALGAYKSKELLDKSLEFNLTDVPKRNRVYIVANVARNPEATKWIWGYYQANFQTFMKEFPISVLGNTLALVPSIGGIYHEEEVLKFLEMVQNMDPRAKGTAKMAAEMAQLYSNISKR
ncbi:M1 family metallopeptidase [Candidatus Lokiarchaeum ossiferum]|uniref:M1 family metallopeptidase n=1 Tax=Candidatus Lokiarchaeum ossiferum TaxID=2951803 RepID=UPI00352C5CE9